MIDKVNDQRGGSLRMMLVHSTYVGIYILEAVLVLVSIIELSCSMYRRFGAL